MKDPVTGQLLDRVVSAEVTVAMRTANGRTITYEFHNITFSPDDVLHENHGIVMDEEHRTVEAIDARRIVNRPDPLAAPVLTLTIKGELRADDNGVTHLIRTKEPEGDADAAAVPA